MFERFTDRARHVVVLAQEEARQLQHNYIGTEHLLLGLLGEPRGIGAVALQRFGISRDQVRDGVVALVGIGKKEAPRGHIPFTPRAKKVLELALREALQLGHNYIGTEHILLGMIREGDGVAAQVLRQHADLMALRMGVLDLLPPTEARGGRRRAWLRRRFTDETAGADAPGGQTELSATPAADVTLSEAARLAGAQPVGSHHLLLAALADADSAAARALGSLGVNLDQARTALRDVDITGTSDEPPEEAGRRAMTIRVAGERVIVEAVDPVILEAARGALQALGDQPEISGGMAVAASLSHPWQALRDSLETIQRNAKAAEAKPAAEPETEPAAEQKPQPTPETAADDSAAQ